MVMGLDDGTRRRPPGNVTGGGQSGSAGPAPPVSRSTYGSDPSQPVEEGSASPYVPRDITPGASSSWGDLYRNLVGTGGGGGPGRPAPTALTPQTVTAPTVGPFQPATAAQVDWRWQDMPSSGPVPPPGGGGGGGGGGGNNWDVSQVNLGQYAIDPEQTQMGLMDPIQAAQMSQQYQDFNQNMYGRVTDYMDSPVGYSPEEFEMMQTREADRIARQGQLQDQSLQNQMNQMGLGGGGTEMAALQQAGGARQDELARMKTDLALQDMALRRQGRESAMQLGTQFSGQQGQLEAQQQQMQNQINQNNQEMQFAIQSGNMARAQEINLQNQQLYAQSDQLNQGAENEAMMLRNNLNTQRGIAGMQTRAQRDIASQGNALQRELAMNQMGFDAASQNAQFGQQAGLFNAGQQADLGMFNAGNQLQAGLANQAQDWTGQTWNANRMDAWSNANAAAAGAGNRFNQQMQLQGIGADINQQQYNDDLMFRLLGMNQGQQNWNMNQAGQYGQQVYGSNPSQYQDPYAGMGWY